MRSNNRKDGTFRKGHTARVNDKVRGKAESNLQCRVPAEAKGSWVHRMEQRTDTSIEKGLSAWVIKWLDLAENPSLQAELTWLNWQINKLSELSQSLTSADEVDKYTAEQLAPRTKRLGLLADQLNAMNAYHEALVKRMENGED